MVVKMVVVPRMAGEQLTGAVGQRGPPVPVLPSLPDRGSPVLENGGRLDDAVRPVDDGTVPVADSTISVTLGPILVEAVFVFKGTV